jgi:type II secretory pathway predicted ATPase ExeA
MTTPDGVQKRKYHVALSFAGEDRNYVQKVAEQLLARNIKLFYDKYEEVELWGKNLYEHLSDVYANQAYFTVMFISQHYKDKLWTNHERQSAQSRAFQENKEYILPVRFDATEIPGVLSTTGYLALHKREPEDLARLVEQKLAMHNLLDSSFAASEDRLAVTEIIRRAILAEPSLPPELEERQDVEEYASAVANNYVDRCHHLYENMRILAMPKPVELSHIFTQVRVADRITGRQSATEIEVIKDIIANRGAKEERGINAISLFEQRGRAVLLGRPGSGKSTFLKYMVLRELQNDTVLQVPLLLPLNELDQRNKSVFDNLVSIIVQSNIAHAEVLLRALLASGRLRLLIDGLDELRFDDRTKVVKEIEELMNLYQNCSFLVTCRTAAYEFWFSNCRHYEVQRFSKRSIISFVLRWFSKEKRKARELLSQILSSARMRDLCSSPLMLTIVCIGFDAGIDLSNNRAEIYKDAIDALLRKWDASRSIYRDNVYRTLTPKRREDLLCDLAARTFVDNQIVITAAQAEDLVGKFLKTMPSSPDTSIENDAAIVLRAIETQHGLIEKRSIQFWAFAHLTFQEFFVAQYLASRDPDLRSHVAKSYIDRPEWREVIMLTAALLPNADEFVLDILKTLTKIGYGEFFVKQTLTEIRTAQQSVEHRRFQSETLFPRIDQKSVKYRQPAFGVIEGGVRLTVDEIQVALVRFRESVGTGGSTPNFLDIIDGARNYRMFRTPERRDDAPEDNTETLEATEPEKIWEVRYKVLRREIPNILLKIEEEIHISMELAAPGKKVDVATKTEILQALLASYHVFETDNSKQGEKLNILYEPNNLFELTSRKHMFIVPDCLDDCVRAASGIIDELALDRTRQALHTCFHGLPVDAEKIEEILVGAVKDSILFKVRLAAAKNKTETAKLRAFIAGDTLAEILMSQAFLTPIVREAAVRTLNNIVGNVPPTPTDTPPADIVKGLQAVPGG